MENCGSAINSDAGRELHWGVDGSKHGALVAHQRHPHEPVVRGRRSESPLADEEFMHMAVLPSHRTLQHVVQLRQSRAPVAEARSVGWRRVGNLDLTDLLWCWGPVATDETFEKRHSEIGFRSPWFSRSPVPVA